MYEEVTVDFPPFAANSTEYPLSYIVSKPLDFACPSLVLPKPIPFMKVIFPPPSEYNPLKTLGSIWSNLSSNVTSEPLDPTIPPTP